MTNDERLNLRAKQILDDASLSANQRVKNPGALLKQLAANVKGNRDRRKAMLAEITDVDVRAAMDAAVSALIGPL